MCHRLISALGLFLLSLCPAFAEEPTYWQNIRPILRKNCTYCHNAKNLNEVEVSGGLALDKYEAIVKGSKRPVVIAGKSKESLLLQLLRTSDEKKRMPKDSSPLQPEQIELIARWVDTGVKEGVKPDAIASAVPASTLKRLRQLDVVLATNAIPPKDVLSPANPAKLELALKVGPLAPVTATVFSPDGKLLATGAYGRVTIWDLATGKPAKVLTNVLGAVNDIRFSPDSKLMVVAGGQPSARGDLRLYDTANWQMIGTLGGHEDVVFSVAFSPDGKRLASASFDKTLRLWDLASRKQQLAITDHSDFVYSVAFSPDGKWLASASKDRSVKMFDAATGKSLFTFSGMNEDVLAVAVSADGKQVVSSGLEPGISWWAAEGASNATQVSASPRIRVQGGHGVAVHELGFSKDGKFLISAGGDGTVRLWSAPGGAAVKSFSVGSVVYAAAISSDGKRVATGSFDGLVRLWDVDSGRQLVTLLSLPSEDKPLWLTLTPDGYADLADELKPQSQWRMGGQAVAAESVWNAVHKPDMLLKAVRGEVVAGPTFAKP